MKLPTQSEWETCLECLEAFKAHTEETEPHAVNTIARLESVLMEMPFEVSEAFGGPL